MPKEELPLHIFRSYDVRGVYKTDIDELVARRIGKALGSYIGKGKTICVARDYRNGSDSLKAAFVDGVLSVGTNVVDLGILPTPVLYFSIIAKKFDGGAMITASHNPAIWNGIKLCREGAGMISEGHGMEQLKNLFVENPKEIDAKGKLAQEKDILPFYYDYMLKKVKLGRKLKVVVDPGNGAWCGLANELFAKFGCDVIEINGKPDGNFPARGPDPSANQALSSLEKKVVESLADFGVAFDGDGDRAAFVDNKGRSVGTGDILISIFAKYYLKDHKNSKVVYDVTCSEVVAEVVSSIGSTALINKTGHTHITTRMIEEGAVIGGEYSNHLYFADNSCLDDGCFAALKLAEVVSNSTQTLSELSDSIPHYPNVPETLVSCPDEMKSKVIAGLLKTFRSMQFDKIVDVDGIKAFKEGGWVLVRASNTMPQIKINSEGKDMDTAQRLFKLGNDLLAQELSKQNIH